MGFVPLKDKIAVLIGGIIGSILIFFILEVLVAFSFMDIIEDKLTNIGNLYFVVTILYLLSLAVPIIAALLVSSDIPKWTVNRSLLFSFLWSFFVLLMSSYFSIFINMPEFFIGVEGPQIIFIFPAVLIAFGVYILHNIFYLFFINIIVFTVLYIIFLEVYFLYEDENIYYQ